VGPECPGQQHPTLQWQLLLALQPVTHVTHVTLSQYSQTYSPGVKAAADWHLTNRPSQLRGSASRTA
jgi:hypothetical protein